MSKKIILFIIILISLNSCKTVDMILNSDNYIKRDGVKEVEIRYDTVIVTNNEGSLTSGVVAGINPKRKIIFDKIGQSYTFVSGETIELITDGVDFGKSAFDVITNGNSNDITIKLIDIEMDKVKLTSKCETIERNGIDFIPKIEVAEGLDPEQIVITPLFDNNCVRTGYQVRYGSSERGCKKEAADVLDRFKKCAGKNQSKQKTKIKDDCIRLRKLGIPCN